MPWVDGMVLKELKSANWIAQGTRSQAANGNKLEICKLQDWVTCLLHYKKLMTSVETSAPTTTNSPKTNGATKKMIFLSF